MNSNEKKTETSFIKIKAKECGFDLVGIAPASFDEEGYARLRDWLNSNKHAAMGYMAKNPKFRCDPRTLLSSAKTIIMLGKSYKTFSVTGADVNDFQVAPYALSKDYHLEIKAKLNQYETEIKKKWPSVELKSFVDSSAILERSFAYRAGLGFFGKNTTLIHETFGSRFFIAGILFSHELEWDTPVKNEHCQHCDLCVKSCPTQALKHPFSLDASRCIAYQTVENKGITPVHLRAKIGKWLFGCDLCQAVCPFNQNQKKMTLDVNPWFLDLTQIFSISSNHSFQKQFKESVFLRVGKKGMIRNAVIVAANSKDKKWVQLFEVLLKKEENPVLKEILEWALKKLSLQGKISENI